MISLVLCHGRKHRNIPSINYDISTFVDIDPNVEPDLVANCCDVNINIPGINYYDEAVIICGNAILKSGSDIRKLNIPLVNNIYRCLKIGGHFYVGNGRDPEEDNIYLSIRNHVGFEYLGKYPRLDIQRGEMKVFRKI